MKMIFSFFSFSHRHILIAGFSEQWKLFYSKCVCVRVQKKVIVMQNEQFLRETPSCNLYESLVLIFTINKNIVHKVDFENKYLFY